jgi:hypothetical protein
MFDFRIKIRIIWITALAAAVFVLVWLAVIPGGKITYSTDFKGGNEFISKLTPKERVNVENDGTQVIIADPAYFSLRTSRAFNATELTVKFKPDPSLPIVEAGISTDGRTWQYDLEPLYNAKLETLMKNWSVLQRGDVMLFQRDKKYNTIDDFLANPPAAEKLALSNYDFKVDYLLPGYQSAPATTTICRPLVGAYQFYTYIKDEDLTDDFVLQDMNENVNPSPVDVNVYYNDKLIANEHLADDGVIDGSGAKRLARHLKISLANLPEGVYKVELKGDGDIITRTITTSQSKMAFVNTLSLADAPEVSCGRELFIDGETLSVQTSHPAKLGKITFVKNYNSSSTTGIIDVNQTYKIFSATDLPSAGTKIVLANDGVLLSSDGLFSFFPEAMIDSRIREVDANFDADKEGVDYVLARYTPPAKDGDWLIAKADFNLSYAFRLWNKYYFIISAPGLAADGTDKKVLIKEIKINLSGTSFLEKIGKIFKK